MITTSKCCAVMASLALCARCLAGRCKSALPRPGSQVLTPSDRFLSFPDTESPGDIHRFEVQVAVERLRAELAAESAVLHSAERRTDGQRVSVDADGSGVYLARNVLCTFGVSAEHRAAKPLNGVVG